jgi:hypothetical protein
MADRSQALLPPKQRLATTCSDLKLCYDRAMGYWREGRADKSEEYA